MSLQVDDPIDSAMQEFIICYNQAVEFKHPNGHNSRQYNVRWSSRPHAIAYVYPYGNFDIIFGPAPRIVSSIIKNDALETSP